MEVNSDGFLFIFLLSDRGKTGSHLVSLRLLSLQNRRYFFVFFRRAEASTRRAQSANHTRQEGHLSIALHAVPAFIYERSHPIGYLMSCDREMLIDSKCRSRHRVLLTKLFENHFVFSKCGKGKTNEMYKFIVEKAGCTWIASSWVWKKLDLAIADALIVFLRCSLNNRCLNILAIKFTNLDAFWMAHDNLLTYVHAQKKIN